MKKKFRDSAISSEDLDDAIANRIELAFKEQQSTLNSVVNSAVRDAMDSMLIPALRELRELGWNIPIPHTFCSGRCTWG